MIRAFPRKRESRAKYAGPSLLLWIPAFAGMSGIDLAPFSLTFGAWPVGSGQILRKRFEMARATTIKVKLVSSADTGFYYVTKKNSRTMTEKLVMKKYDPVAKKHVEFREAKIK